MLLQVTVVDAKRWQKRWWHNKLEVSQTVTATHVLLNWTHAVSDGRRGEVERSIAAIAPRATFISAEGFEQTLRTLADDSRDQPTRRRPLPLSAGAPAAPHVHHTEHPFASALLPLPPMVDRARFTDFVRALPESVIRAKGFVRLQDRPAELFIWNRVDGRKAVSIDQSWPDAVAAAVAVLIGVDLPLAELHAQIAALQ